MKKAIIVFLKPIVPGRVKTRLAKEVGDLHACHIYKKMIEYTAVVINPLHADLYLFYDEFEDNTQQFFLNKKQICLQQGNDLGARMENAFQYVFQMKYDHVLIIGSDCPMLTSTIINQAFEELESANVVIGPATDGGYYLLGLRQCFENIFKGISWSTDSVLSQTIDILKEEKISFQLLPELSDVDTLHDLLILPEPIRKLYDIGTD